MGRQSILIGRGDDCDVVVSDKTVSKLHAELVVTPQGRHYLTDCGSTNGTWRLEDDEWVEFRQAYVGPDEPIRLGDCKTSTGKIVAFVDSLRKRSRDPSAGKVKFDMKEGRVKFTDR